MDWQQMVSLLVVGTAAAGLAASHLRRRKLGFERGGLCGGCAIKSVPATRSSIVLRARKGQRREVWVKQR
jgi:hypothetical protein